MKTQAQLKAWERASVDRRGSIGPHEELAAGTMIKVGNKRGNVVSCDTVPAYPCGMICVHTIQLTDKSVRDYGHVWHWEPIKEKAKTVNYTAITVA